MANAEAGEDSRLALLREQAEWEMRRRLPGEGGRPSKRRKGGAAADGTTATSGTAPAADGGRFHYGAPKELASGITGFLLTCPIQRENSARKEAVPLLQRYLQQCAACSGAPEPAAAAPVAAGAGAGAEASQAAAEAAHHADGSTEAAGPAASNPPVLASIKLACRGVVALKYAGSPDAGADGTPVSTMEAALVHSAVAALVQDVGSGTQARLAHVQRIIPIQATCLLEPGAVRAAGTQLAALVAAAAESVTNSVQAAEAAESTAAASTASAAQAAADGQQRQVTFGIAVKHRCSDAPAGTKPGPPAKAPAAPEAPPPAEAGAPAGAGAAAAGAAGTAAVPAGAGMDRGAIIAALAAGFEQALREQHGLTAAVDLKAPSWVLVAEVLPVAGDAYLAVCAVPRELAVLKPKLHILPVGNFTS